MTTYRNLRAIVLVAASAVALAAAIAALAAVPAAAQQSDGTTYKVKGKSASRANLLFNGNDSYTLEACDRRHDGYGAVAILQLQSTLARTTVKDKNGYHPHECGGQKTMRLAGGQTFYLWACIKDHDGNVDSSKRLRCQKRPKVIKT